MIDGKAKGRLAVRRKGLPAEGARCLDEGIEGGAVGVDFLDAHDENGAGEELLHGRVALKVHDEKGVLDRVAVDVECWKGDAKEGAQGGQFAEAKVGPYLCKADQVCAHCGGVQTARAAKGGRREERLAPLPGLARPLDR